MGVYADSWSLGVLLYTVLQGVFPFRASTEKELFAKISSGEFEMQLQLSPEVAYLIKSFLRLKPEERMTPREALNSAWFAPRR